jgi:hypothetical protein
MAALSPLLRPLCRDWKRPNVIISLLLLLLLGLFLHALGANNLAVAPLLGAARLSPGPAASRFFPGPAAFLDPSRYFTANPFLRSWGASAFAGAARALVEYRAAGVRARLERLHGVFGHAAFDGAPATQPCELQRYGFGGIHPVWGDAADGGKHLCDLPALAALRGEPCVVYSLGSNGQFDFEESMVQHTPCEVHTFDCTLDGVQFVVPAHPRIHFHPLCAGEGGGNPRYMSIASLAARLNHTRVHLLKMDIEGFEFRVVESLYGDALRGAVGAAQMLPLQISLEVHAISGLLDSHMHPPGLSAAEMDALWVPLTELGYAVVSREDNKLCKHCAEFTVVRAFL